MRKFSIIFVVLSLFTVAASSTFCQETTGKKKYWIYFDKKNTVPLLKVNTGAKYQKQFLSERAIKRRLKVRSSGNLIGTADLPINNDYLKTLERMGIKTVVNVKWLNAVSAYLNENEVITVKNLPFVKKVKKVAGFYRSKVHEPVPTPVKKTVSPASHTLDYGVSFTQLTLIKVPEVHDLGISGKGVLVGILDSGFKVSHEAFANTNIIAERDFIYGDGNTANEEGDRYDQDEHGTATLSNTGAFLEGTLIGSGYGASYVVGKTEDNWSETSIEEDYWIAGLMWMDSLGCDIVSSSVGYTDWYEPTDMDGQTAPITIAADLAVNRGIVVINSAGNEYVYPWKTVIAPADGFFVIAVGGTSPSGAILSFSSRGPTADGRIKPDVCAQGTSVYCAESTSGGYGYHPGTSYAAPLTTGVAALILSAHPYLTPTQVRQALRKTADQADNPDNDKGWGVVNAYDAVQYFGTAFSNLPTLSLNGGGTIVTTAAVSKNGISRISLNYNVNGGGFGSIAMQPAGQQDYFSATIPTQTEGDSVSMYFSVVDEQGDSTNYPHYPALALMSFSYGETKVSDINNDWDVPAPEEYVLHQNYPNPFNPSTTIEFDLPKNSDVRLSIYSISGSLVRTLVDGNLISGRKRYRWNGKNNYGINCASGIYIYRLETPEFAKSKKMILIH